MRARSLLLAVLAITLCGCAAGSHLAAGMRNGPADPVPWISATPTTMLLPTPSPTVIPAGLPNLGGGLGGLPEGLSENLAEQLSKMPSGLSFPQQGPQGNIPAAFRGGGKRKKK